MAERTCSIEGCGSKVFCRGWCSKHYARWQRHGDPHHTERIWHDDEARFWSYVDKTDGCWLWRGATDQHGYGLLKVSGRLVKAYRFAYETLAGPIPDGMTLDHLCRNPPCVNPTHLEPVTLAENTRRGVSPTAVNGRKTHCIHGHEFTSENTYRRANGGRKCRECMRRTSRESKQRQRTSRSA